MSRRGLRLSEQILREISEILHREVRDPRLGFVTVSRVDLTDDYSIAKVMVSVMGDDRERAEVMKGLRSSAPFVRSKLGRRLHVRTVPEVIFVEDRNLDHAYRINEILSNLSELKSPSTASATPSEQE
jgi:ribosome-binding factor A